MPSRFAADAPLCDTRSPVDFAMCSTTASTEGARFPKRVFTGKANNPRIPHYLTLVALGELLSRNIEAAVNAAREAHEQAPHDPWCGFVYVAAVAEDQEIVQTPPFKGLIQSISLPLNHFRQLPFTKVEDVDYLEHRLRKAGYIQSP